MAPVLADSPEFSEFCRGWNETDGIDQVRHFQKGDLVTEDGRRIHCVIVQGQPPYNDRFTARLHVSTVERAALRLGPFNSPRLALQALWSQDAYPLAKCLPWPWILIRSMRQAAPPRVLPSLEQPCAGALLCTDPRLTLEVFVHILSFLSFAKRARTAGPFAHQATQELEVAYLPKTVNGATVLVQLADNTWRVSNAKARAETRGLGYRQSKSLEDGKPGQGVQWGTLVNGIDEDEWVKVMMAKGFCEVTFKPGRDAGREALSPIASDESDAD